MRFLETVMWILRPKRDGMPPPAHLSAAQVPNAVEFERKIAAHDREMAAIGAMVEAVREMTPPPPSGEDFTHGRLDESSGIPG